MMNRMNILSLEHLCYFTCLLACSFGDLLITKETTMASRLNGILLLAARHKSQLALAGGLS